MAHPKHLISLTEWLYARFPNLLIPEDFVGYIVVVPQNQESIEWYDFQVRRIAQTVLMHAEYVEEYGGWIIQHMSENEKREHQSKP